MQEARSQFLNAKHLKLHARYSLSFGHMADEKTIFISRLTPRELHLIYPHIQTNIEKNSLLPHLFSRAEYFLN
jgi:hypothetical protein